MIKNGLPTAPVLRDTWDMIREDPRPVLVYGMGNGADKLLSRMAEKGIEAADFFASDGFVRGHSFHGKRVLSFCEAKEKYEDFQIVLAFASHREEVLAMLFDMAEHYTLRMPDLPVSGDGVFDKDYYNTHYEEIREGYNALSDEGSRALYASLFRFKLTGDITVLREHTVTPTECYALFSPELVRHAVDAGAYTGDTVRECIGIFPYLRHIYGIEPDPKSLKRLLRYAEEEPRLTAVHAALWNENGTSLFSVSGNRNSTLLSGSYQARSGEVPLMTLDHIVGDERIDYIKYDVEGVEKEALLGSMETIRRDRPYLNVSVYHRNEDLFSLLLFLQGELTEYSFSLLRTPSVPAWEIRLIGVPNEKTRCERKGS